MCKIVVIIPVKDDQRVTLALDSLMAVSADQDGLAIIVVDNNSSEESYSALRDYCCKQRGVTLLVESGEGSYAARNRGILYALNELQAQILAFIDSDCIVSKAWLASIKEAFEDQSVAAVSGRSLGINRNNIAVYEQMLYDEIVGEFLGEPRLKRIDTRNFAARSSVFESAGLFLPVKFGGDMEFGARIHSLGMVSIYRREMVLYHENPWDLGRLLVKRVRQNYGNHELQNYCDTSYLESYLPHLFRYRPAGFLHKSTLFVRYFFLRVDGFIEFQFAHKICLVISKFSRRLGYIYFKAIMSRACRLGDIAFFLNISARQI